jgi:hypothetical protein
MYRLGAPTRGRVGPARIPTLVRIVGGRGRGHDRGAAVVDDQPAGRHRGVEVGSAATWHVALSLLVPDALEPAGVPVAHGWSIRTADGPWVHLRAIVAPGRLIDRRTAGGGAEHERVAPARPQRGGRNGPAELRGVVLASSTVPCE